MNKKERIPALLIIGGPTASGKSSLAEDLAARGNFPIISADSRQIYRGFDIGTAKPSPNILASLRYEMIDIMDPEERFSAGKFAKRATEMIYGRYRDEKLIIITGGTGFYITALTEGLAQIPEISKAVDQKWNHLLESRGIEYLQAKIKTLDPEYQRKGDLHNTHRLLRAIKVAEQTGRSIYDYTPQSLLSPVHQIGYFAIHHERNALYARINERVDQMIEEGLVEEVRKLLPYRDCPAMKTVGYKELIPYLEQKISLTEAVEKIKQYSRNYAKRQLTWLRRNDQWTWITLDDPSPVLDWIEDLN